ncbi:DUF3667 domain-containing protein [Undibacterium fentianense]|uniref:DUF3667 domain-containing protein n=1 Tax=Undibacterium fentianense TaxID=2828728 RepID=A0A941E2Z1_9BURK|nr:DUF3667 domain-containing protein [Undibacterium fentianense]MBR7801365.1 DUF3667 domain-containing protein [Undibacterium fentianense]
MPIHEVNTSTRVSKNHLSTQVCANCGAEVEKSYCPECGQNIHIHHSLLHLVEELLHGLFHFDTKAWRTIPALTLRPGELTRNYIQGQRTRYVSPLALFLFLIFSMFFVFNLTSGALPNAMHADKNQTALQTQIDLQQDALIVLQQQRNTLPLNTPEAQTIASKITEAESTLKQLKAAKDELENQTDLDKSPFNNHSEDSVRLNLEKNTPNLATPFVVKSLSKILQNPELALYKFKNTLSKLAFLLVPISLPFLWLLFAWRRQNTMFEHAVFSLHSLSFMSMLMMLSSLLAALNWYALSSLILICVPPIHMFHHLRGTYQLGRLSAVWRSFALSIVALLSLAIFALIALRFSI